MTIIDLDHTLIQTDLLWEQAVALIIEKPWTVFYLPFWLLSGRLHFKLQIAKTGSFEPQSLPYRSHVLERIEAARKSGQTTVLASASPDAWIQSISAHLGIFDHAFGSQDINLKGEAKWAKIKAAFSSNGENPKTEYFGDSGSDLAIWKNCAHAVAINPSRKTLKRLAQLGTPFDVIRDTKGSLKSALKQLRPHQWVKNLLLFIPLLAAHHFLITSDDAEKWGAIALAFFSFSAAASSIYILNDLIDLQSDRNHPTKKARPLASGDLSIPMALGLLTVSAGAAIVGGAVVSQNFSLSLLCYFGLNLLYSLWLKRAVLIDVVLLAALYTLRILAGGFATNTPVSQWLLSFSVFFFFGLAMVKRFTEIDRKKDSQKGSKVHGRGYSSEDRWPVFGLGASASMMSVVILVLYLNSETATALYHRPEWLWLITPVLLYWISRVWLLAARGEMHDDPVVFALRDHTSWLVGVVAVAILGFAL